MTVSALPTPPSRADSPDTFAAQADALLGALPQFVIEANALQTAVNADAASAAMAATTAATQAELATTQAELATTNGAAQVTLAATQAELATTQAGIATTQAGIATTQAAAAAASAVAASKLNLGNSATAPTVDNQGAALRAGATYYDTTLNKWRAWTGSAWGDGVSAVAGVASVNGLTGNVVLPPVQTLAYADRATLRSLTPGAGEQAIVNGLGLFVWQSGSDEPDDDESCFATAAGRWLLEAVHWDVVDLWQLPEVEEQNRQNEERAAKTLHGSATCAITSVASIASASFTGTVTGAAPGDRVIATPPAELGATPAEKARLGYHAWVSAPNTVTVMLTNASAALANTNAAIRAAWPITVIKS